MEPFRALFERVTQFAAPFQILVFEIIRRAVPHRNRVDARCESNEVETVVDTISRSLIFLKLNFIAGNMDSFDRVLIFFTNTVSLRSRKDEVVVGSALWATGAFVPRACRLGRGGKTFAFINQRRAPTIVFIVEPARNEVRDLWQLEFAENADGARVHISNGALASGWVEFDYE